MPFNGYLTSYPYSIDELERSRPKDALSEVEKYKKRYPKQANTPIIGALKCVALQRLGRDDEAYETFLTMVKANRKVKNGSQNTSEQIEEIPSDAKTFVPLLYRFWPHAYKTTVCSPAAHETIRKRMGSGP
jgi:hypothetical protein